MKLQIDKSFDLSDRVWVISPGGEIDISTAAVFRSTLDESFSEKKADIRIDLKNTDYLDSTGLGVIIGTYNKMKEEGYCLYLTNPQEKIKKLLDITKLDKVLC